MPAALATLSFTCAVLIAVFVPVQRVRTTIPQMAIVVWLGGYSLIHGINAVLWSSNTNIHIPVWCDIVTKLMLGANIALPGAFLSTAIELRRMSTMKPLSTNPIYVRNCRILEVFLCYVLPVMFMFSHLTVQDNRFDIVKDFGCSAATHPSTLGFVIVWIPPVLVCALVFVFCAMCIHNSRLYTLTPFKDHLASRSSMTPSIFYRRIATCMIMTGALSILNFSALFTVPKYKPWVSFASVHKTMSVISIVKEETNPDPHMPHGDFKSIEITWWGIFATSVLYIVLSLSIGEESRDAYKWIVKQVSKKRSRLPRRLVLPVYNISLNKSSPSESSVSEMVQVSHSPSSNKSQPLPLTLNLKSGWDDTISEKSPWRMEFPRSPRSVSPKQSPTPSTRSPPASPSQRPSSPSVRSVSSSNRSMVDEDTAFMESTLTYLGSPTARTLGIAPLQIPPPALSPRTRSTLEIPPKPSSPPPSLPKQRSISRPSPKYVPQDIEEPATLGSVLNEAWPIPPASPTPSRSPSRHAVLSRSPSHTPTDSAEEMMVAYPLFSAKPTSPHRRSGHPFDSASISSFVVPEAVPPPLPSPNPSGRMESLVSPTMLRLGRRWSRERLRQGQSSSIEKIHMTVVHETVV